MNKPSLYAEQDRLVRRTKQACSLNMLVFFKKVLVFSENI